VRRLIEIDLWEISLVTFPLLAGARVHALKQGRAPSRPAPSFARTRAEKVRRQCDATSVVPLRRRVR